MSLPIKSALSADVAATRLSDAGASNYNDLHALASLKKDSTSPQALHAVAQQIDALFLQMMLKSMRDAGAAGASPGGEGESNEMSMYHDMFDKQVALSMSRMNTLGIGAQLTRQIAARAGASASALDKVGEVLQPAPPGPLSRTGSAPASADVGAEADPEHFVADVYPAIERTAKVLGVSPLAILAQAALETGWGKRMPRAADGRPSFNLFGIKADDAWKGARVGADTVEFSAGIASQRRTTFRAYASIDDSVEDFARVLKGSPRYREALSTGGDPRAYVTAIGNAGYATDPQYADKLNDVLHGGTLREVLQTRRILL